MVKFKDDAPDPRAAKIRAILDTVDVDDGGWSPPDDWYVDSPHVTEAEKDRLTHDIVRVIRAYEGAR